MNNLTFPNAVVIGAPKCGTSSLYFWLSAHPETPVAVAEPAVDAVLGTEAVCR